MSETPVKKTPAEVLIRTINWAARDLGTTTISSSAWKSSSSDITISNPSFTNTTATATISGGVVDNFYAVTNSIVLNDGETLEETIIVKCEEYHIIRNT